MAKIELPHVQGFTDRHGKRRHYYRRKGVRRIPLPGVPGSADFMAAYAEAVEMSAPEEACKAAQARVKPRSVNALIMTYYASQDFLALQPTTQRNYRHILDRFRTKYGERGVGSVQTRHLEAIFLSMAGTPGATRNLRKRLATVFSLAVRLGWRTDNPVKETRPPKSKSKGFPAWSEEEITRFRTYWPSGSRERLAFELLLCLGQRRSDTRLMGRQHMQGPNRITVVQQKGGKRLVIRIHTDLQAEIDQHPNAMTFVTTAQGAPFSAAGFTQWLVEKAVEAGVIGRSPHGLRKAAGRRLAEAGCTAHEIMAILGHSSLSEAERYTRDARQEVLAEKAMDRLQAER